MQSSATVACRAGVMLACLIAIPLAAVFGTRVPDLVKRLLSHPWNLPLASGRDSLSESPPFGPSVSTPPWGNKTGSTDSGGKPGHWQASVFGPARQSDAVPATYDSPAEPAAAPASSAATAAVWHQELAPPAGWTKSISVLPVGHETLGPGKPGGIEAGSAGPIAVAETRQLVSAGADEPLRSSRLAENLGALRIRGSEQLTAIEQRLRELGAAYYALETWGAQGQFYRFHARMAVHQGADCCRHFQSVDADPLQAMVRVLDQVETWRADRRNGSLDVAQR